jgi:cytochrome c-type biogenesis protein CcmF
VIETRAEVAYSGPQSGTLGTALRDYPNSPTAIATPAVRTSLAEDLYVTLLASDPATGAVTLHLFVNPLVVWIWIGGMVVGIGSVFAMWPDRARREVVVEQRQPVPAATAEGA